MSITARFPSMSLTRYSVANTDRHSMSCVTRLRATEGGGGEPQPSNDRNSNDDPRNERNAIVVAVRVYTRITCPIRIIQIVIIIITMETIIIIIINIDGKNVSVRGPPSVDFRSVEG